MLAPGPRVECHHDGAATLGGSSEGRSYLLCSMGVEMGSGEVGTERTAAWRTEGSAHISPVLDICGFQVVDSVVPRTIAGTNRYSGII